MTRISKTIVAGVSALAMAAAVVLPTAPASAAGCGRRRLAWRRWRLAWRRLARRRWGAVADGGGWGGAAWHGGCWHGG